jgi:hypothetical protein
MLIEGVILSLILIPVGILLLKFRGKLGKADVDSQFERQKSLFKGTKYYSKKGVEKAKPLAYKIQNGLYFFLGVFLVISGICIMLISLFLV